MAEGAWSRFLGPGCLPPPSRGCWTPAQYLYPYAGDMRDCAESHPFPKRDTYMDPSILNTTQNNPCSQFKNHCLDTAVFQVLCLVQGYSDKERIWRAWAGTQMGARRYPGVRTASRVSPSRKRLGTDKSCPELGPPCLMGEAFQGTVVRQGISASGPPPCIGNLIPLDLNLTSGTLRSGQFPSPPKYSETFCAPEAARGMGDTEYA